MINKRYFPWQLRITPRNGKHKNYITHKLIHYPYRTFVKFGRKKKIFATNAHRIEIQSSFFPDCFLAESFAILVEIELIMDPIVQHLQEMRVQHVTCVRTLSVLNTVHCIYYTQCGRIFFVQSNNVSNEALDFSPIEVL